jgi:hypothetical protein
VKVCDGRGTNLGPLKTVQKCDSESFQPAVGQVVGDGEGVAGDNAFVRPVHDGNEPVGGGLGADALAWDVEVEVGR